jgi:hypothetical protein
MSSCRAWHGLRAMTVTPRSGAGSVAAACTMPVSAQGRVGKPAASRGRLVSRQTRQHRVAWESPGAVGGRVVSRASRFALDEMVMRCVGTGERTGEYLVHGVLVCVRLPSTVAAACGDASKVSRRRSQIHEDGTGAAASARLPGCGCAMSAVKRRAGPRPICVHQRASFCICVESFFLCRMPHCHRPGEAWRGIEAWRCAFWCMGCFRRGSDWRAAPDDRRIGAWGFAGAAHHGRLTWRQVRLHETDAPAGAVLVQGVLPASPSIAAVPRRLSGLTLRAGVRYARPCPIAAARACASRIGRHGADMRASRAMSLAAGGRHRPPGRSSFVQGGTTTRPGQDGRLETTAPRASAISTLGCFEPRKCRRTLRMPRADGKVVKFLTKTAGETSRRITKRYVTRGTSALIFLSLRDPPCLLREKPYRNCGKHGPVNRSRY